MRRVPLASCVSSLVRISSQQLQQQHTQHLRHGDGTTGARARLAELETQQPPHHAPDLPVLPHLYAHSLPAHHRAHSTLLTAPPIASLLVYILGLRLLTSNFVMIFIITILLLAVDFYYLKNIAGRRLVGLRWWNEVDSTTGDGRWVFESADPETREINATDK
ncbi:MAG: DUF846 domain-containing protein, partial [Oxalobacteraceae bacterium]